MVEDLVDRRLQRGMPMREVRALLGPPDGRDGPNQTYYFAGSEWSFFLDTCLYLDVEAANGRLRNAVVHKDD